MRRFSAIGLRRGADQRQTQTRRFEVLCIAYLILGAGKIGALISGLLAESGAYKVNLCDVDGAAADSVARAHGHANLQGFKVDAADTAGARQAPRGKSRRCGDLGPALSTAMSELPKSPASAGIHYFDLTEDVEVTRSVRRIAAGAERAFVPQCGLAPGFISIAANELITHFDKVRTVKLRVGALPQHPNNVLKYSLTWSTDGLINEYGNPCQALVDGREVEVAPLEGLEEIEIDGTLYEAFNTSGGLGSLAETHGAKTESMNYKTIRYPGHCDHMRLLMNDLKLNQDRATLKRVLENAVPQTLQDVVIVYAAVTGTQDGQLREENYVNKVYPQVIAGTALVGDPGDDRLRYHRRRRSRARQRAASIKGFVAQEQFSLPAILANRFGRYYAPGGTKDVSSEAVVSGKAGHAAQTQRESRDECR